MSSRPRRTSWSSRFFMTCCSLCLSRRAALADTPMVLARLSEGMPSLDWVTRWTASIQMGKGRLVEAKMVPWVSEAGLEAAVIDTACDYAGHSRARDRISGTGSLGGQRIFNRAWWHCFSVPYVARNRGKLSPS